MTTLKVIGHRVVDALDGTVLHRAVFSEQHAETLYERLKRKCPAAMVERVEPE
jgi:hypothetical protein